MTFTPIYGPALLDDTFLVSDLLPIGDRMSPIASLLGGIL